MEVLLVAVAAVLPTPTNPLSPHSTPFLYTERFNYSSRKDIGIHLRDMIRYKMK